MRIVSWVVVVVSAGWLLAFNLGHSIGASLPTLSTDQVSGTVAARAAPGTPADLNEFATRYTAAWNSHDATRVASFYAPGGRMTINQGAAHVGTAGLTEMADGFLTDFPDLQLTMQAVEKAGDRVVYRWTFTGTHAQTGQPVRISGSETWRFGADGLISESVGHYDPEDYERQVRGESP